MDRKPALCLYRLNSKSPEGGSSALSYANIMVLFQPSVQAYRLMLFTLERQLYPSSNTICRADNILFLGFVKTDTKDGLSWIIIVTLAHESHNKHFNL